VGEAPSAYKFCWFYYKHAAATAEASATAVFAPETRNPWRILSFSGSILGLAPMISFNVIWNLFAMSPQGVDWRDDISTRRVRWSRREGRLATEGLAEKTAAVPIFMKRL
jgi:hypothetical protein